MLLRNPENLQEIKRIDVSNDLIIGDAFVEHDNDFAYFAFTPVSQELDYFTDEVTIENLYNTNIVKVIKFDLENELIIDDLIAYEAPLESSSRTEVRDLEIYKNKLLVSFADLESQNNADGNIIIIENNLQNYSTPFRTEDFGTFNDLKVHYDYNTYDEIASFYDGNSIRLFIVHENHFPGMRGGHSSIGTDPYNDFNFSPSRD